MLLENLEEMLKLMMEKAPNRAHRERVITAKTNLLQLRKCLALSFLEESNSDL